MGKRGPKKGAKKDQVSTDAVEHFNFSCLKCGKKFKSEPAVNVHMRFCQAPAPAAPAAPDWKAQVEEITGLRPEPEDVAIAIAAWFDLAAEKLGDEKCRLTEKEALISAKCTGVLAEHYMPAIAQHQVGIAGLCLLSIMGPKLWAMGETIAKRIRERREKAKADRTRVPGDSHDSGDGGQRKDDTPKATLVEEQSLSCV